NSGFFAPRSKAQSMGRPLPQGVKGRTAKTMLVFVPVGTVKRPGTGNTLPLFRSHGPESLFALARSLYRSLTSIPLVGLRCPCTSRQLPPFEGCGFYEPYLRRRIHED